MKYLLIIMLFISCSSSKKKEASLNDKKANLHFTQGTTELVRGEYHSALKNLRLSAKYRPNDSQTQNNLGMAYFYRKSPLNALKHLRMAVQIDPKNQDARLNLGSVLMNNKNYVEAESEFNKILKSLVYNQQYKTHYNLGVLAMRQNQVNKSIKNFKMSIEVNENYCPSYYKLGDIYKRLKKFSLALKYFQEGSKGVCYSFFLPTKEMLLLLIKKGDFDKAELKLTDAQERFTQIEEQQEIMKLKRYLDLKRSKVL